MAYEANVRKGEVSCFRMRYNSCKSRPEIFNLKTHINKIFHIIVYVSVIVIYVISPLCLYRWANSSK